MNCPVIVALDLPDRDSALRMVDRLRDYVDLYKVGMELFYSEGSRFVRELTSREAKVFLDLKFHDIPNTVASAVRQLARLRPAMMTVHAPGGFEMLRQASRAVGEAGSVNGSKPILLAITLLTSIDEKTLREDLMVAESPLEYVVNMARVSQASGIDGVVASPREAERIREVCGRDLLIVTPGIRPSWFGHGDQKRVATPSQAIRAGADYIVVGRPIIESPDPVDAARRIIDEAREGAVRRPASW
ncbi:MAG: orotidine-5'-phosphate decarboxylase [Firmicutes bacterium]|nr:orotidine-5'-phosphate decarboxylase [Bacillota bacterium]